MYLFRLLLISLGVVLLMSFAPASATKLEVDAAAPLWMHIGAGVLLYLHIGGGALGILSGTVAIFSRKGEAIHRTAGKVFFVSMLVCYVVAVAVAPFLADGQRPNFIAGVMALYLLWTSWLAATRREPLVGVIEYAGLAVAVLIAAAGALFIHLGANDPSGTVDGSPPQAFTLFLIVGVIAALGDMHVIVRRSITGVSRISRHLWRMCMSLFIASGSFFFGQEQMLPDWLRGSLLQSIPVFLPLGAILIWLVWVRMPGERT